MMNHNNTKIGSSSLKENKSVNGNSRNKEVMESIKDEGSRCTKNRLRFIYENHLGEKLRWLKKMYRNVGKVT